MEYEAVRLRYPHLRLPPYPLLWQAERNKIEGMDREELIARRAATLLGRNLEARDRIMVQWEGELVQRNGAEVFGPGEDE